MNILVILTDQQSSDALGFLQSAAHLRTPALDALAARGCVFTQAQCAFPLCGPSRNAMFTGRYPHQTGIVRNNSEDHVPPVPFACLGTHFRAAGYDTGYVGKWHVHIPLHDPAASGFEFTRTFDWNGSDPKILAPAREFLLRPRAQPFLLVASYNNPHNICEWARTRSCDLPDGQLPPEPPVEECPPLHPAHTPDPAEPDALTALRRGYHATTMFPVGDFDEATWRRYRWAFYRMVELVDAHIGALLETLRESGRLDDTLVVFTSDHGDAQGAWRWNQKTLLHDASVRVPFILAHPGRIAPGTCHQLVNTGLDLLPTLLGAAGLPIPADLPGQNLFAAASGAPDGPPPRDHIVVETTFAQHAPTPGLPESVPARLVRSARFKYACYAHGQRRESLTDLLFDPHETRNVVDRPDLAPVLDRHREWLREHIRTTADTFPFSIPST